jgi:cytochrome c5
MGIRYSMPILLLRWRTKLPATQPELRLVLQLNLPICLRKSAMRQHRFACSFMLCISLMLAACGQSDTTASPAATAKATAPAVGVSNAVATDFSTDASTLATGASIYQQSCFACHDTGAAGAPKRGDKAAWAPRLAQGSQVLYTAALKGINAMPPRGGSGASDADIKAAVDYIVMESR